MPASRRSYSSGHFFLNLDGLKAGLVHSVEGRDATAEVVTENVGPDFYAHKHIGNVRYNDFAVQMGLSMAKPLKDWIDESLNAKYIRKDGSLVATDLNMNVKSEREFFHALITEIGFPAMDGASKEPAYLTLKFAPEYVRFKKPSGKLTGSAGKGEQRLWLASNFRLEIDGLDCTRVSKVDSLTVKRPEMTDPVGRQRDYQTESAPLEVPNPRITLNEHTAQSWKDWHHDFVIRGNSGQDQEKNGALTFLAPNLKEELARVDFHGLGIFRLTPEKREPQSSPVARVVAELYCERMDFAYLAG
jgi:tail tube protein gp19